MFCLHDCMQKRWPPSQLQQFFKEIHFLLSAHFDIACQILFPPKKSSFVPWRPLKMEILFLYLQLFARQNSSLLESRAGCLSGKLAKLCSILLIGQKARRRVFAVSSIISLIFCSGNLSLGKVAVYWFFSGTASDLISMQPMTFRHPLSPKSPCLLLLIFALFLYITNIWTGHHHLTVGCICIFA